MIDGIMLGIIDVIIAIAIGRAGGDIVGEVIYAVYLIALLGSCGKTVGNMALSTQVVDAATGSIPSYGKAALRWLVMLVLGITIIGGFLDILWPLWDQRNQTLHDKAAGTLVVRS